jgi:hypothetical protein
MSADPADREQNKPCAIGTIRYSCVDGEGSTDGTLIYIKPILTGTEPSDVLHYAQANPLFPQQSTGDQFFSESQFESYRELGRHTIAQLCGPRWENEASVALRAPESTDATQSTHATDAEVLACSRWQHRTLTQFVERVERQIGRRGLSKGRVGPRLFAQNRGGQAGPGALSASASTSTTNGRQSSGTSAIEAAPPPEAPEAPPPPCAREGAGG